MKRRYTLRIIMATIMLPALLPPVYAQEDNEEINAGYGIADSNPVTGAVSVVSGSELERSPVSNLSQTFAGRLSGLITMENNGMPGRIGTVSSYVRGLSTVNGNTPLFILDGVICSLESIDYIIPQEVESICVLKDASLTAIYGVEGGSGAIVVNTKRGRKESLRVTATFDQSFQQMTRQPVFIESWQYATMRNQAWSNDGATGLAPYTQAQIDAFRDGSNRDLYPNNDWYGMMFRPWALSQKASISTTGGNDRIRMFSNINFSYQGGQFIHDDATFKPGDVVYDPKAGSSSRVNFRTNLDFNITGRLSGYLRLNGNVAKENAAGNTYGSTIDNSHRIIYSGLFMLPPTLYGPFTPITGDADNPGGNIITNEYVNNPPYGMLNRSGYGKYTGTNIMAQSGLNLDMDFITDGLQLTGSFAYETNSSSYQHIGAQFQRWVRSNNPDQLEFNQIGVGTWDEHPLDHTGSAGLGYKLSLFSYRMHAKAVIDYNRRFGRNEISAMAYGYYQNYISGETDATHTFPYNRVATGISALWGYEGRYHVKIDAAYSGSEEFARDHRFILTPAVSAGWVITEEKFMPESSWLTMLNLRASAGITASDRVGNGRFMYASNYANGGNRYIGTLNYMITEYLIGNPELAPEKTVKQNYGLDFTLFKSLSFSIDYFRSLNTNMAVNPANGKPAFAGISASVMAPVNEGRMMNNGIEISMGYMKAINSDTDIWVNGNFMYAKNTIVENLELPTGSDYAYKYRTQGYSAGQMFGYLIDRSEGGGYFTSQEQIDAVYYSFGTPRLGDFRYLNLNGDKTSDGRDIIDEKDLAPIGYPTVPQIIYGAGFGFRWKGLELSLLIQGTSKSSRAFHNATGFDESLYGGVFSEIHLNAWTPERAAAGDRITFPALSGGSTVSRQPNDFFIMDTSYIRLKNVEICYSVPESLLKPIRARQLKFVLSANNLFTFDRLPGKSIDPEISSLDSFQNYRVFNVGVRVAF